MKFSVLASGSKGNCSYIETKNTKILVDLGLNCINTERRLNGIGVNPSSILGVVITHTHSDHINGLRVFIKKYNPIVYLTQIMYDEIHETVNITNYVIIDADFIIDDLTVNVFKTSHDSTDSNGYIFESNKKSLVYITDTGYINVKYHKKLSNKNYYIMESNHDIELLMNGSYPYYLKQRILSDHGHLSNQDSAYYLSKFIGKNTDGVVLIHLSEENNDVDVAIDTLKKTLNKKEKQLEKIVVAKQHQETELIEV